MQNLIIRRQINNPLMNPHLIPVKRRSPIPARRLPRRHPQPLRRQRNRPRNRNPGPARNRLYSVDNPIQFLNLDTLQFYPNFRHTTQTKIVLLNLPLTKQTTLSNHKTLETKSVKICEIREPLFLPQNKQHN